MSTVHVPTNPYHNTATIYITIQFRPDSQGETCKVSTRNRDGGLRHKHEVDVGQHYHTIMSPHCTRAHKWYAKVL